MKEFTPLVRLALAVHLSFFLQACPNYRQSVIEIDRQFTNTEEEKLIAKAERYCPPYEEVVMHFNGTPPPPSEECLWWFTDRERFPYAITEGAVWYYIQRASTEPSRVSDRARLRYQARLEYNFLGSSWSDDAVAVVILSMKWDLYCGPLCGESFVKERIIEFDSNGEVLSVSGDGPAEVIMAK